MFLLFFCLQMRVMDNKLFSIEPRQGQLAPGQEQAISFSYRHEFAGTDRLPVMFKVSRGREILVRKLHKYVVPRDNSVVTFCEALLKTLEFLFFKMYYRSCVQKLLIA